MKKHTIKVTLQPSEYEWIQAKSESSQKSIKKLIREALILFWSIDNIMTGGE